MQCPFCKISIKKTRVIDTRETPDGIRRRRKCESCQERFTTYEYVASTNLLVIKRDKRREDFNKEKLITSLRLAFTKRPTPIEAIKNAAVKIEEALNDLGKREIQSSDIGELVMDYLRQTDDIAYVRFASVYRCFQDVDSIADEIKQLQQSKQQAKEVLMN